MALAFETFLTEGFLGAAFLLAADLRAVVDFFLAETFLPVAFLREALRGAAFAAFLLPVRLLAVDFRADFLTVDFFAPFFLLGLRAAAFFRAAGFFFDTFLAEDFDLVLLTFLLAPGLRVELFLREGLLREGLLGLLVPARLTFFVAAFLAGIFGSCRSEKNAELYIGCVDMEALNVRAFRGLRLLWRTT